jgi:phosphonate transport system substrate-binding protein
MPRAAWSAEERALVLGVFPRNSVETTVRAFTPLADVLAKKLGRDVRLETARDFEAYWQALTAGRYDIVHYNQYHYVRSAAEFGYEVVGQNVESGKDRMAGAIVVRADSDLNQPGDLVGKRIAFGGGPSAMMSHVVPKSLLLEAGIDDSQYKQQFTNTPPNAVFAVFYGHADAAGVGDGFANLPAIKSKIDTGQLKVLVRSEPLAHLPWAFKDGLGDSLKQMIRETLLSLSDEPAGRAALDAAQLTRITSAKDEDYDPHRLLIASVLGEDYCIRNCGERALPTGNSPPRSSMVLGVFPRRGQKVTENMFAPLAAYLTQEMEVSIELDVPRDFEEFWKGVGDRKYDLVHYNQYQYVKSHKLYGYDAILMNEEQGISRFRAGIWVRKDSGFQSLEDLRGGKIIFGGGKQAMMAYTGPTWLLKQAGLTSDDYEENYAITPLAGCKAMYLGQADACGSGEIMFKLPALKKQVNPDDVTMLAQTEPLAFLVWAVKQDMPETQRVALQQALSNLEHSEQGEKILESVKMTDFVIANDSDFFKHREIIMDVLGEQY